jgi:hypothetical protein
MAALMLFAIESHSSSQRAWPNQALELTAARTAFSFLMTKIFTWYLTLDVGSGSSALSR